MAKTNTGGAELQRMAHPRTQVSSCATLIALAVLVPLSGMAVWFAAAFALMGVDQTRYREVAYEAARSGVLDSTHRPLLAPSKVFYPHQGDDCLTLVMLVAPRESRLKAAISPRVPAGHSRLEPDNREGFPAHPHCNDLAAMLHALKILGDGGGSFPEMLYYHRYIHGTVTIAALLLSVLSFKNATASLLGACYALLAWLILAALFRLRSKLPSERRRAVAFLFVGLSLVFFYALPLFGRQFAFAPVDIVVIGFILFALFQPLARISEVRLFVSASLFGTVIAIFDRLTSGIPMALSVLIVLVVLGEAQDRTAFIRRLALALAAFIAAIIVCLACKQLVVWAIWGPDALAEFLIWLDQRTIGGVTEELPDRMKHKLVEVGLSLSWLDANYASRVVFAGIMMVYSAFVIGWGSHVLGAAVVILPVPVLLLLTYFAARGRRFQNWPLELLAIVGAAMVPFAWNLAFLNWTILHSSFAIRPLALSAGLAAVAWVYAPKWASAGTVDPHPG
ncbi:MAG: hypothetical protein ACT4N4_07095 [Rhodospirillales bacterium]